MSYDPNPSWSNIYEHEICVQNNLNWHNINQSIMTLQSFEKSLIHHSALPALFG